MASVDTQNRPVVDTPNPASTWSMPTVRSGVKGKRPSAGASRPLTPARTVGQVPVWEAPPPFYLEEEEGLAIELRECRQLAGSRVSTTGRIEGVH